MIIVNSLNNTTGFTITKHLENDWGEKGNVKVHVFFKSVVGDTTTICRTFIQLTRS